MATKKKAKTPPAWDCLAVTDVKVFPLPDCRKTGPVKAIADVILNDQLVLRGLRVMDGVNGLFVGYPYDPFCRDDDYKVMYNPVTRQLKEHIEACVLEKYHACTGKQYPTAASLLLYSGVVSGTTLDLHNQQGVIQ